MCRKLLTINITICIYIYQIIVSLCTSECLVWKMAYLRGHWTGILCFYHHYSVVLFDKIKCVYWVRLSWIALKQHRSLLRENKQIIWPPTHFGSIGHMHTRGSSLLTKGVGINQGVVFGNTITNGRRCCTLSLSLSLVELLIMYQDIFPIYSFALKLWKSDSAVPFSASIQISSF